MLNDENIERLQLDMRQIKERARRLKQPGLLQKISRVYNQPATAPPVDVDAALYQGFLQDADKSRCQHFHQSRRQGQWPQIDFADPRLQPLAEPMKARSHPELLSVGEHAQWQEFVAHKLHGEGDWLNLSGFNMRLDELTVSLKETGETSKLAAIEQLRAHGSALGQRYPKSVES